MNMFFVTELASPSQISNNIINNRMNYFDLFLRLFPTFVALWVAWSNQRFNCGIRLKTIKVNYCERYIESYITLRSHIVEIELASYDILRNLDCSYKDQFLSLEVSRRQAIVLAHEAIYNFGMVSKLLEHVVPGKEIEEVSRYGHNVLDYILQCSNEVDKQDNKREYVDKNYKKWCEEMGKVHQQIKSIITDNIDLIQNEIIKLH